MLYYTRCLTGWYQSRGPSDSLTNSSWPDFFLILQMAVWGENHSLLLHLAFPIETTALQNGCLFWAIKTVVSYTTNKTGLGPSVFSLCLSFPHRSFMWRQFRAQGKSWVLWGWRQRWRMWTVLVHWADPLQEVQLSIQPANAAVWNLHIPHPSQKQDKK